MKVLDFYFCPTSVALIFFQDNLTGLCGPLGVAAVNVRELLIVQMSEKKELIFAKVETKSKSLRNFELHST